MSAITTINSPISPAIISTSSLHFHRPPVSRLTFLPSSNARVRVSLKVPVSSKQCHWAPRCCSGNSGINPETTHDSPDKESSINIKLPRRSLLVQFTCDSCGERTKRLINRLAYERGTVFVQCSGCLQHHQLVDNLGLVVEYDFRNDTSEK